MEDKKEETKEERAKVVAAKRNIGTDDKTVMESPGMKAWEREQMKQSRKELFEKRMNAPMFSLDKEEQEPEERESEQSEEEEKEEQKSKK